MHISPTGACVPPPLNSNTQHSLTPLPIQHALTAFSNPALYLYNLIHLKQFCSERGRTLKSGSMEIIIRKGRLGEGVGSYVAVAEPCCHLAEPQIVACDSS